MTDETNFDVSWSLLFLISGVVGLLALAINQYQLNKRHSPAGRKDHQRRLTVKKIIESQKRSQHGYRRR